MTTANPEQEARAAVTTAMSEHHAYHCTPTERLPSHAIKDCPAIMPALDRLCTERYLAGKVEGLAVVMRQQQQAFKHVEGCTCHGCNSLRYNIDKAEAEYAACVAALQEAKHG